MSAWKQHAEQMALDSNLSCLGLNIKDILEGGAESITAARGRLKNILERHHDYVNGDAGFVATVVSVIPIGPGGLTLDFDIPGFNDPGEEEAMEILEELTCGLAEMYAEDAADPPDPDYMTISPPEFSTLPTDQSTTDTTLMNALDRQAAYGEAALAAYQRYQGALAAGDPNYEHAQAEAVAEDANHQVTELSATVAALRDEASALDALPEFAGPVLSDTTWRDNLAALYQRISTDGFNATRPRNSSHSATQATRSPRFARTSCSTRRPFPSAKRCRPSESHRRHARGGPAVAAGLRRRRRRRCRTGQPAACCRLHRFAGVWADTARRAAHRHLVEPRPRPADRVVGLRRRHDR